MPIRAAFFIAGHDAQGRPLGRLLTERQPGLSPPEGVDAIGDIHAGRIPHPIDGAEVSLDCRYEPPYIRYTAQGRTLPAIKAGDLIVADGAVGWPDDGTTIGSPALPDETSCSESVCFETGYPETGCRARLDNVRIAGRGLSLEQACEHLHDQLGHEAGNFRGLLLVSEQGLDHGAAYELACREPDHALVAAWRGGDGAMETRFIGVGGGYLFLVTDFTTDCRGAGLAPPPAPGLWYLEEAQASPPAMSGKPPFTGRFVPAGPQHIERFGLTSGEIAALAPEVEFSEHRQDAQQTPPLAAGSPAPGF